ncbi:MAG: VCBS repeat-containing protein [Verrucomicrobiota bacterium]
MLFQACSQEDEAHVDELVEEAVVAPLDPDVVREIVSSEELILSLTPKFGEIGGAMLNLELPGDEGRQFFAEKVRVGRLLGAEEVEGAIPVNVSFDRWSVGEIEESVQREGMELWKAFLEGVRSIEHGKIYPIRGSFLDEAMSGFVTLAGSSGVAKMKAGGMLKWEAKMEVEWERDSGTGVEGEWRIVKWQTKSFETKAVNQPFFSDVLGIALENPGDFQRATQSRHEQMTVDLLMGRPVDRAGGDEYPFFFAEVTLEHPGVAVVDLNKDGFDDVFVAMPQGTNLFLRNKGDGTFEECAYEYGLNETGYSSAALFGDFDNDGDADLVLGRPRHRGQYWRNDEGKFVEKTAELMGELPYLISSISAADYNGDGLLDLYFATYGPIEAMSQYQGNETPRWVTQYLSDREVEEYEKRNKGAHVYLEATGPPNLLLTNVGDGKFEVASENGQVRLWLKSFHGGWSDFDQDGDPDLYVANDYGPDHFLRNDGESGFTDVTELSGMNVMGFGMGVTWGDYDNDGKTDLYVSNMFSKAGQRILRSVGGIDERFNEMSEGNFLYRGGDGEFELVSGLEKDDVPVAKAGWAWGAQFVDFNNDGWLDLYSPNGFYTAPRQVAAEVDL